MKSKILFLFLLFLPAIVFAEPQTVYLRNGQILHGDVINQTAAYIDIKLQNGETRRIQKETILRIAYREPQKEEPKKVEPLIPVEKQEPKKQEPEIVSPPPVVKEAKRVVRSPLERHYIDFYLGAGNGTFSPQTIDFYYKYQNIRSIFVDATPFFLAGGPKRTAGTSVSAGINYKFKKFSIEAGGMETNTSTSSRNIGPEAEPIVIYGSYPEQMKAAFFKTSYSALSKSNFELYPSVGYIRTWNRTKDSQSQVFQQDNVAGKSNFQASESLSGTSIGLGFAYLFGSKVEIRSEFESLSMKGSQSIHQDYTAIFLAPPYTLFVLPGDYSFDWKAKGTHASLKLSYFWKMGIGFFIKYDSYQWKYSLQDGSFPITLSLDDDPPTLSELVSWNFSQKLVAQTINATSRATSIQFGISKTLNFGPEENY
ncbi:hypothetical protein EHO58_06825 [Leptospira selangorensis]|uniref:LA_0442/LA_0875 N-terminal domain-containing protein n=1 Tax=Leptospira selangorensis TaxID=2484982 RepID=UPI0010824631|nr:hypothetical protein [Leptospira selangorensis]TGK08304.1 hypothetical protein EHO58_06825 [Leptospira selangorensis]